MQNLIYKIVTQTQWEEAVMDGVFRGAPIDLTDGFIHFSAAHQVRETAARHFPDRSDLLLVAFDPVALGAALRWEVSRGGDAFPHLYAALDPATSAWMKPLPWRDGVHDFSGLLP